MDIPHPVMHGCPMCEGYDLEEVLKSVPLLQYWPGYFCETEFMWLKLWLELSCHREPKCCGKFELECVNALDYTIRPERPSLIEGMPCLKIHSIPTRETVESCGLIWESVNTTQVPGGDGDEFEPPLRLKLLLLDQSFVLAERFVLRRSEESSLASLFSIATDEPTRFQPTRSG